MGASVRDSGHDFERVGNVHWVCVCVGLLVGVYV